MNSLDKLKLQEEQKRDQAYDPAARWIHIQETITGPRQIFRQKNGATALVNRCNCEYLSDWSCGRKYHVSIC
jgi:hypothetical protein